MKLVAVLYQSRATVLLLFLNDSVHSAAEIYMAWFYCIGNYTNPEILLMRLLLRLSFTTLWPFVYIG